MPRKKSQLFQKTSEATKAKIHRIEESSNENINHFPSLREYAKINKINFIKYALR